MSYLNNKKINKFEFSISRNIEPLYFPGHDMPVGVMYDRIIKSLKIDTEDGHHYEREEITKYIPAVRAIFSEMRG